MKMIETEYHGKVAVIKLNRGVINAINLALIKELSKILKKEKTNSAVHSLVLTSANEKFFSIGFDIPYLIKLKRKDFRIFYRAFNRLFLELYTFPKPVIAAITGHATAGGCILAICCDYRLIAEGRKLMSLNEVELGVPVPYAADRILRELVGFRNAREIMGMGEFYESEQLLQMGVVDEILPLNQVLKKSIEKTKMLGSLPQKAFAIIKQNRTETVKAQAVKQMKKEEDIFIDCWYSKEAQKRLKKAMEKF